MSLRMERVAELLRGEIAQILCRRATDPRLRFVTLTRVDVAPDLKSAIVFWSSLRIDSGAGTPSLEEVEDGLVGAASFLRRHLAEALPLRRVPELRFRHDPSLELGGQTLAVLQSLREGNQHGPEDES